MLHLLQFAWKLLFFNHWRFGSTWVTWPTYPRTAWPTGCGGLTPQRGGIVRVTALCPLVATNEGRECQEAGKKSIPEGEAPVAGVSKALSEICLCSEWDCGEEIVSSASCAGLTPHSEQKGPPWRCHLIATGRTCCTHTAGGSVLAFLWHCSALVQVLQSIGDAQISVLKTQ